ncbi:uncharacterized protein LOC117608458 [Osmia lignaria lignaria]|uniref:uncharacterized protein LOC117608458 n=1 Tax=Osmia lignaria lignaria TaxID=1437193 RepID=UPI00402B7C13
MDLDEVIVEKIINNKSLSDKSSKEILNIEKGNSTSNVTETLSSAEQVNIENCVSEISQITSNCEVVLLDENVVSKQNSNEKSDTNKQQEIIELLNVTQSEKHVQNKNYPLLKSPSIKDNDVCIVYENNAVKTNDKVSSLNSIAVEYNNSDSEIEDISDTHENNQNVSLKGTQMQTYRQNKEILFSENSDYEDDSTSSSSSSISIQLDESDSDDNTNKKGEKNKTKGQKSNEMKSEFDDLPPIEELQISVPEVLCDPLGEVAWMVEQLVVVKPKAGKPTLNLDTVLFVERGQRALGKIFDVFGQVSEPHYCVRFNNSEHIEKCDIKVGMTVYYCPNTEYTSLVFLHEIMKIKGIDANADEPPEFSDDEEERAYYEKLKAKQTNNSNETDIPLKRKRTSNPTTGWQSNHPWSRNTQKNRKGYYPRGECQQFPFPHAANQSQNLWSHYQNWPQNVHSENNEQYGYGTSSMQSMQYVNSMNQNFYSSHNYYNEDDTTAPLNPRIPFNVPPRISPGYLSFQNRPNSSSNVRFQNSNMPWQSQIPMRMRMPWVPLPPPPPPPPPPTTTQDMN